MAITTRRLFSSLLLLFFLAVDALASDARIIDLTEQATPLDVSELFYFVPVTDKTGTTIDKEQIASGALDNLFTSNKPEEYRNNQWFKAHFTLRSNTNNVLYFPVQALMLHHFGIWVIANGQEQYYELGYFDTATKPMQHGEHFAVPLPAGDITVIGNVKNGSVKFNLPIQLSTASLYEKEAMRFENFTFAFYAIYAVLFIYNLVLWISLRETVYGVYLLFLLCSATLLLFIDGNAVRIFSDISRGQLFHLHMMNSVFSTILYGLFAYLSLEQLVQWKKIRRLYHWAFLLGVVLMIYIGFFYQRFSSIILAQSYGGIVFVVILISLIYGIHKKIRMAYYLFIAEMGVVIGGSLTNYPVKSLSEHSMWFLHAGFLWEAIFISLALAEKTRAAKEEVVRTLSKFEKIYQSTPQGLFSYSILKNTYLCNNTWAQMHGFNSQEDINVDYALNSFAENIENENIESLINKMRVQGEISDIIYHPPNPLGTYQKTLLLTMRLLKDEDGNLTIIEGTGNDITEILLRKEVEKQKAIIVSNSESKNSFFASINHELRTPLTSILGYAQAIQGSDVPIEEKEQGISIIERSGKHLLQLINDLLDLSKLEAKKLTVEKLQVPIFDIFFEIEDYFGILAKNKNISFDLDYRFPLPATIISDPTRFKQILINLCSNALKFTEKGFVRVHVSCNKLEQQLIIKVQDTGIGLSEEQQANLFQAYTQADQSVARKFGGTGLGLSLSRQLANLLGGDITLTSTPREGSTFTFTLATGELSYTMWLDKTPSGSRKSLKPSVNIPSLEGRVLFIEDNQNTRELITGLLEKADIHVTQAGSGEEGLMIYKQQAPFDLVITDINMPGMDGITLCQLIKKEFPYQHIVTISALVNANDLAMYKEYGFSDILSKPVDQHDLYALLQHYLKLRSYPAAPKKPSTPAIKVLVAEDNIDNQNILAIFLSKANIHLTIVENGQLAVDSVLAAQNDTPFDLVLMDLQMPVMDGLNAMKELRARGIKTPIIAFTASEEAKIELADEGFDGFLSKPISKEKLLDCIANIEKNLAAQDK